jgi:RNA polymerase sigma factor (sigma-70 family)
MDSAGEAPFRSVYDEHRADVLAYFLRRLNPEDAAEATADVFLVVWRRIDQLPPVSERRLWLFGVAHNVLRNRQRMGQRLARLIARAASTPVDSPLQPETIVVRRAEEAELLAALDRLSLADSEVLRLRLWEELGFQEIASVLGCSAHAAEQRYAKALRRMRSACRQFGHVVASGTRPVPRTQEPTS